MGRRKEGRKEQREGARDPTVQDPVPSTLGSWAWRPPARLRTCVPWLSALQGWITGCRLAALQAFCSNQPAETLSPNMQAPRDTRAPWMTVMVSTGLWGFPRGRH